MEKKSPNILTLLCRVREKVNIFSQFLKAFLEYIYVSTLKFRFFEKTKKICRNLIFYIYWVKGTWISLLYNYILVIRDAQPIIFPSTGRNSFFILPINLKCHIAQKSQILSQKTNIVLRKLWTWMVAKMFYLRTIAYS